MSDAAPKLTEISPPLPELATPWVARWRPELIGTLMFVLDGTRVMLIRKKTGHGAGRINGPGGKLVAGESLLACAMRETLEETGLRLAPEDCRCMMEMRFVERDGPQWLGFAFVAHAHAGHLMETPEAHPFWCDVDAIPYAEMWPDDAVWLPQVIDGARREASLRTSPLVANFLFEREQLLAHAFADVPSLHRLWG